MVDKHPLAPVLIAMLGIMFSGWSAWIYHELEQDVITKRFQLDIDKTIDKFDREIKLNLDQLYALGYLYDGSEEVTSAEFKRVAEDILSRHHSIRALEWIPRIKAAERVAHEHSRSLDYPGFEITERLKQGRMIRRREQAEYYPVSFVVPMAGNELAVGFDLASNPVRQETLAASCDAAIMLATASVTLVQETTQQLGFLAFLPLYDGKPSTRAERRARLLGFILGVFGVADIFNHAVGPVASAGMHITVLDGERIIYQSPVPYGGVEADILHDRKILYVAGREWRVKVSPAAGYLEGKASRIPWILFILGVVLSIAVATYAASLLRRPGADEGNPT